jgi:outer membrane protein
VLRALDNLNASRAQERANQRQLEQTQQRFDVGLIAITDVHEARAAYDLSVATRLGDEGNLGVALERLSVLTGQRHENIWLLKPDYPVLKPDPMEKEEWVNFALDNNYTVKASAYARDAANESAKASKSEHAPKIGARLGYDENRSNIDRDDGTVSSNFDQNQKGSSVSLNLTIPLYSGGFISASRRQAYQEFNRAQENYSGAVRTTIQTTRALHLQTTVDVATTNARKLAITSTRSAYEATQAGYEVGTRNIVDVLNVQQSLFSAVRDYANARYQYVVDMLKLKNQAGLISPQDVNDLNQWLIAPEAPTLSETGLTQ